MKKFTTTAGRSPREDRRHSRTGILARALAMLMAVLIGFGMVEPWNASAATVTGDDYAMTTSLEDDPTGNENEEPAKKGDMTGLVSEFTITDSEGKTVEKGGTLYVDEKYHITLTFAEGGEQSTKQFEWNDDGIMTYQLPKNFKVDRKENIPLKIDVDGKPVEIGKYSVTEDGKLVVTLNDVGKERLKATYNAALNFEMDATVQAVEGGDGEHVKFDGAGEDFDFKVVDQARVKVDKKGEYTENEGKTGGSLKYTVTTTVERGSVSDLSIRDEFTPPNTSALKIEDVKPEDIEVTLKRLGADGKTVTNVALQKGEDYELVEVPDDEYTGKKTFQVKLKEGSKYYTLNQGDVLEVTYPYKVEYVKGSTDVFWGNVVNDAYVTGKGKVPAPADEPDKVMPEIEIDEHQGSNVEIQVTPPGDGIIFKTQEFSETDHTLHYTLYTTVPKGNWNPFFILDDMVVEFGGKKYNLKEFKKGGRVSNLKVSAVDVENGELGNWSDSTSEQRQQSLEALKKRAKQLTGYDMEQFDKVPTAYNPDSLDNYICLWLNNNLEIVFGKFNRDGLYGTWEHEKDRLIITEYDLKMPDAPGDLTLVDTSDYTTEIKKSASDVLLAGIRNTVHMRFSGYNPGYSVFFNNSERMNKTGVPDKSDNSITWTVTMNTTDTTVNKYFQDVVADWMAYADKEYHWGDNKAAYDKSMQAVFYDELPDGWEYVEGSLTATACDTWNNKASYPYNGAHFYNFHELVTQDGNKQVIRAPLMFFNDKANKDRPNLFNWIGNDLASLTFTYKLKATEKWIRDHATDTTPVEVKNYADIRDNIDPTQPHWTAEKTVDYLPQHLSKEAKQVEDSNLLQFTLHVNQSNIKLDKENRGYLVVTDTSENLEIQTDSIQVKDAEGKPLTKVDYQEGMTLNEGKWAIMPATGSGQFKLMVPDGKELFVTYNAWILKLGSAIPVSNTANIEGVVNSESPFKNTLNVNKIEASGSANTYTLKFEKVDSTDVEKKLSGAEFKFYIVRTEDTEDGLPEIEKIEVGSTEYSCYSEPDWVITTDANGQSQITSSWRLGPGNYYILKETKAPAGYENLKEPILFYYNFEGANTPKTGIDSNAKTVLAGKTLTISDPPITYVLPETGGPGTTCLYLTTGVLLAAGGALLLVKKGGRRRVGR